MADHTTTFTAPGTIALAGHKNFVIRKAWSSGGAGDNSPATAEGGFVGSGSPSGGGGACGTNIPIPNADIADALGDAKDTLYIDVGGTGAACTIGFNESGDGIELLPGEDGSSCGDNGDQAEGGRLGTDSYDWAEGVGAVVTDGRQGLNAPSQVAGFGGGGAAGISGTTGSTNSGQTGGTGGTEGGAGGNGGNIAANGAAGTTPGGGGGGGGLGTTTGGAGGGGKAVIEYDDVIAPVITSNGGGATASITTQSGVTAVTTVTAAGDPDFPNIFLNHGGPDTDLFAVNSSSGALTFSTAPTAGVYVVIVEVTNEGVAQLPITPSRQTITVTVTGGGGDTISSLKHSAWPELYSS